MNTLKESPIRHRRSTAIFYRQRQTGATLVEFSIISSSLLLVGLLTLQMGLLYHAKTVLNYAAFEAARAGAVNNASLFSMRKELGYRLAPLQGGDGSRTRAMLAIGKSELDVLLAFNTKLYILNPTEAAFQDWGVQDSASGQLVIPVNHLRHQEQTVGSESGLSLRDANILKLKVVHGVELQVPFAGRVISRLMESVDPENALYYRRNVWPLHSVATVRMQSDAYESEVSNGAEPVAYVPPVGLPGVPDPVTPPVVVVDQPFSEPSDLPVDSVPDPTSDSVPAPDGEHSSDPLVNADTSLPPCEPDGPPAVSVAAVSARVQTSQPGLMPTHEFRELLASRD